MPKSLAGTRLLDDQAAATNAKEHFEVIEAETDSCEKALNGQDSITSGDVPYDVALLWYLCIKSPPHPRLLMEGMTVRKIDNVRPEDR